MKNNLIRRGRSLLFIACLVASSGRPALSQEMLTLDAALRLAREQNLKLRQQRQNQEIAVLEEKVQKSRRLPSLDVSANATYLSEVNTIDIGAALPAGLPVPPGKVELGGHDRAEVVLSLRQPLFTGFRLKSQVALAGNSILGETARLKAIENEILHSVYILFYTSQSLANRQKILDASVRRLDIQLQNVRNLFQADQVMAFDTLQVYNQMLTIRLDAEQVALARRLVKLQMARLLDLPQTRPLAELALQAPQAEPKTLAELQAEAVQKRPELEAIRIAQTGADIQQRLARSTYFPSLFAHGNFHYAKPGLDPVQNEWMDYFSAGVTLQWNLWRWRGDEKRVQEFEVIANRLTLEERELLQTVEYEVAESLENLAFSLEEFRLTQELQAQQEERYRILSVQHKNGLAATNDLITAETDLTRADLRKQQALVNYYIHLADLNKAIGSIAERV